MIAEHEAAERERRSKEEKKENKETKEQLAEDEKTENMNRVHEHFKLNVQNTSNVEDDLNVPLSQMRSKKRKVVAGDLNNTNENSINQTDCQPKRRKTDEDELVQPLR